MEKSFEFDPAHVEDENLEEAYATAFPLIDTLKDASQDHAYESVFSSVHVPFDEDILEHVQETYRSMAPSVPLYVFVCGIGGSSLGAKAILCAAPPGPVAPEVLFIESPDPVTIENVRQKVAWDRVAGNPEGILIVVISKSGTTTETLAAFSWLYTVVKAQIGPAIDTRIVAVTDHDSELWHAGTEHSWQTIPIPKKVGGRYSVFTAVGLFPLLTAGVPVSELLRGARQGAEAALCALPAENLFLRSALIRYHWYTRMKLEIETLFVFPPPLLGLGRWYRQLTAESLGKATRDGRNRVHLLADLASGPDDLHSIGQLYFGSLGRASTIFLDADYPANIAHDALDSSFFPHAGYLQGKDLKDILSSIYAGVTSAYRESGKPYIEKPLPTPDPAGIGYWMQGTMMETMYLAHLLHVDAFSQPDVERYKKITREILTKNHVHTF
jgi:glucose-6-phosphate isomerase